MTVTSPAALALSDMSYVDIIKKKRGWTTEFFHSTINTGETTTPLPDSDRATALIHDHITKAQEITIITDFDMDGISAGVIAYAGLAELGAQVNMVVPDYRGERNVTASDIDRALELYPATSLIITCDVGIGSHEGIARAHERSIAVLVTDHHMEVEPCQADVVLNPNRIDSDYPNKDICGAQVIFATLSDYARRYRADKIIDINLLAVFSGIGALADVMPLTRDTRPTVKQAIALLRLAIPQVSKNRFGGWDTYAARSVNPDTSTLMHIVNASQHDHRFIAAFQGISILLGELIAQKKLVNIDNISESFIGFTLGPMFNATRRVGGDMHDSFLVFAPHAALASQPSMNPNRHAAISRIIDNNERRKELSKSSYAAVHSSDQPYAPFVWLSEAPSGILGLIASQLTRESDVPAIVINPDTLSGSARSPKWAPIITQVNTLSAQGHGGIHAAGHEYACGMRFDNHDDIVTFVATLDALDKNTPREAQPADLHLVDIDHARPVLDNPSLTQELSTVDAAVDAAQLLVLIDQLDQLQPFGHGFTYPRIDVTFRPAETEFKVMGQHHQHLKVITHSGLTLLWWNKAQQLDEIAQSELVTMSVELDVNMFRGFISPQGIVSACTVI